MLIAKKEKVLLLGQVQLFGDGSFQQGVAIKVNFTQLLQVKLYIMLFLFITCLGSITSYHFIVS